MLNNVTNARRGIELMVFEDLEVGDTIYVKNTKQWDKPIKKTIGTIVRDGIWLLFYTSEDEFIGDGIADRPVGFGSGIFADFKAFKEYWINYHKKNVQHIEAEMKNHCETLENACQDLYIAYEMQDND